MTSVVVDGPVDKTVDNVGEAGGNAAGSVDIDFGGKES
jgi:hypothetical protein